MKRFITSMFLIILLFSSTGCSSTPANDSSQDNTSITPQEVTVDEIENEEQVEATESFPEPTESEQAWQASSPIAQFTEEDIEYLGINCSGDDAEIANCIKEWQVENILYCVDDSGEDITPTCSALVETSEFLPGILTSKDVIYDQLYEGRINGLCLDYAATYCSIAEYYGLQCRIVRSDTKFCEEVNCYEDDAPGWDELEYTFFIKPLLDKHDLPFTLEAINSVAEDTWAHYWAEVFIDGEWEFMDAAARDTAQRYAQNAVVVVDWEEMDKSAELYSFMNE